MAARELLETLLAIEEERGRERPYPECAAQPRSRSDPVWRRMIDEPGLIVPHPRFRERRFVLEPLAEIAPNMKDPVTGHTILELLDGLAKES